MDGIVTSRALVIAAIAIAVGTFLFTDDGYGSDDDYDDQYLDDDG